MHERVNNMVAGESPVCSLLTTCKQRTTGIAGDGDAVSGVWSKGYGVAGGDEKLSSICKCMIPFG